MRVAQIGLLLLAINLGMYFVASTGLFGPMPYSQAVISTGQQYQSLTAHTNSELEQLQTSFKVMETVKNMLTFDWLPMLFSPWYYLDSGVKAVVDGIRFMLTIIMVFCIAWDFLAFIRNRVNPL